MNISIRNGHLVDPVNGIDGPRNLFVSKGKVVAVGRAPARFQPKLEIDATGKYVFPGLVDLCARLREPGEEHKATIRSETRAAASAGITRMVCPPDTSPIIDTPAMVHMIKDRADDTGFARVHPIAAMTVGLRGERLTDMAMLMDAGSAGVSNANEIVENTLVMRRAMQYASTYDIPVFLTPRDFWLQGNGVVHEGQVSTRLGLPAVPEAAETVGVARDLALIETSGARAHFDLVSCKRSVTMIAEARSRGLPVTAGVAIHQLLCSEKDIGEFDTRYKVIPPFRTETDRMGLIEGVKSGTISAICSDHQPHGADSKLAPFTEAATGIAGIDTLLTLTMGLVASGHFPMSKAIEVLSANPARIIGIDAGHLAPGTRADLCLYDPRQEWTLDEKTMRSRGRNSPFMGRSLQGKVVMTLINGKVAYKG